MIQQNNRSNIALGQSCIEESGESDRYADQEDGRHQLESGNIGESTHYMPTDYRRSQTQLNSQAETLAND